MQGSLWNQSGNIPAPYHEAWKSDFFTTFRRRLRIMGIAGMAGYALMHLIHYFVMPGMHLSFKIKMVVIFSVISLLLIGASFLTKTIPQVKLLGFVVTSVLLGFFIRSGIDIERYGHPYTYTTTIIILLFFMSLMLSWDVRDVVFISFLCFLSLFAYHYLHPGSEIPVPSSVLVSKLFWNGVLNLFIGTLFCMVVRFFHNKRDVENFLLLKNVEEQKKNIESLNNELMRDLKLARQIHETLVPKHYESDDLAISVVYEPISEIGGDYASFLFLDEKSLLFLMSDVTGHGVPAALVVNRFENEFQRLAREMKRPGEVMRALNRFMVERLGSTGMFLTAFCGLLDLEKEKLVYTNFGHPNQYLVRGDTQLPLPSLTTMVGVFDQDEIHEKEEKVARGDRILLFTDGVLETRNGSGEEFGDAGVRKLMKASAAQGRADLAKVLYDGLKAHTPGSFHDDVFILSVQYRSRTADK